MTRERPHLPPPPSLLLSLSLSLRFSSPSFTLKTATTILLTSCTKYPWAFCICVLFICCPFRGNERTLSSFNHVNQWRVFSFFFQGHLIMKKSNDMISPILYSGPHLLPHLHCYFWKKIDNFKLFLVLEKYQQYIIFYSANNI